MLIYYLKIFRGLNHGTDFLQGSTPLYCSISAQREKSQVNVCIVLSRYSLLSNCI